MKSKKKSAIPTLAPPIDRTGITQVSKAEIIHILYTGAVADAYCIFSFHIHERSPIFGSTIANVWRNMLGLMITTKATHASSPSLGLGFVLLLDGQNAQGKGFLISCLRYTLR